MLSFTLICAYTKMTKTGAACGSRSEDEGEKTTPAAGKETRSEDGGTTQRAVHRSELAAATGENGGALYIAVKDPYASRITVFDVSSGASFYGPGGPYHLFAGKDATHGLAKSSTKEDMVTGDISNLTQMEKDTHMQWYAKYTSKYPQVGWLVEDGVADGDLASTTTIETVPETSAEEKKNA